MHLGVRLGHLCRVLRRHPDGHPRLLHLLPLSGAHLTQMLLLAVQPEQHVVEAIRRSLAVLLEPLDAKAFDGGPENARHMLWAVMGRVTPT